MIALLLLFQLSIINVFTTYTECYTNVMGLEMWAIDVEFKNLGGDWVAETSADPSYYTATITYDIAELAAEDDLYWRQTVVHELWHLLSWELGELAEITNESQATRLQEQLATHVERWSFWEDMCEL